MNNNSYQTIIALKKTILNTNNLHSYMESSVHIKYK